MQGGRKGPDTQLFSFGREDISFILRMIFNDLEKNPGVIFLYGDSWSPDEQGRLFPGYTERDYPEGSDRDHMQCCFGLCTGILKNMPFPPQAFCRPGQERLTGQYKK